MWPISFQIQVRLAFATFSMAHKTFSQVWFIRLSRVCNPFSAGDRSMDKNSIYDWKKSKRATRIKLGKTLMSLLIDLKWPGLCFRVVRKSEWWKVCKDSAIIVRCLYWKLTCTVTILWDTFMTYRSNLDVEKKVWRAWHR